MQWWKQLPDEERPYKFTVSSKDSRYNGFRGEIRPANFTNRQGTVVGSTTRLRFRVRIPAQTRLDGNYTEGGSSEISPQNVLFDDIEWPTERHLQSAHASNQSLHVLQGDLPSQADQGAAQADQGAAQAAAHATGQGLPPPAQHGAEGFPTAPSGAAGAVHEGGERNGGSSETGATLDEVNAAHAASEAASDQVIANLLGIGADDDDEFEFDDEELGAFAHAQGLFGGNDHKSS